MSLRSTRCVPQIDKNSELSHTKEFPLVNHVEKKCDPPEYNESSDSRQESDESDQYIYGIYHIFPNERSVYTR